MNPAFQSIFRNFAFRSFFAKGPCLFLLTCVRRGELD
ncbi:hypothetical protein Mal33_16470 [Rosistilla oblonga]|uniref:Uncharacterized protein n=1 Tax=Rosistilla oblonga TaxID=2527990 RepID=A0A518IRE8_9BACT|nr:hypothetical protein Mal33_16470 [Rosistilla oblonga]